MAPATNATAPARLGVTHVAIALVFALFWVGLGSLVLPAARSHDFLNLYTGATLAGQGRLSELHDPDVQFALEQQLVPENSEVVPFVRPHFYAALLAPLSWMSLDTALAVWLALHSALLIWLWFWGARTFAPDALILGAMFLPASLGIAHGQDGVFLMALVAASWTLAHKGKEGAAGAVLALGLAKFHLMFCIPPALLLARRWSMLRGYAIMGAALAAISVALGGWTGAERYVALLQMKDLNRLSPSPELMINVHSLGANFGIGGVWFSAMLVAYVLAMLAIVAWKAPLDAMFPAMLSAALLVPPHVYAYDATLLLPVLLAASFQSPNRFLKLTAGVLVTPVIYLAALAGPPWPVLTPLFLLGFLTAHAAARMAQRTSAVVSESTATA